MTKFMAAALAAVCVFLSQAAPALAQDVELRSLDGSIELEGNLISYDGAYYRLDTIYGPITISAQGVSCAGPGCPDLTSFVAEARIAGAATVAEGILPALLGAFAESRGLTLRSETGEDRAVTFELLHRTGAPAARFHVSPGTTDAGFLALLNGEADMALTLREPTEVERRADRAQAPDDPALSRRVRVIALDALVPIVAPDNPIDALTLPDLARIFAGDITNWADLGGTRRPHRPAHASARPGPCTKLFHPCGPGRQRGSHDRHHPPHQRLGLGRCRHTRCLCHWDHVTIRARQCPQSALGRGLWLSTDR